MTPSTAAGRTWEEANAPAALRLVRRFEDAWRNAAASAGRRPDPRDVLDDDHAPDLDGAAPCPGARLALLRAEMGLRWEDGERVGADWFRARHPELGDETFVALVYEEYCLREDDPAGKPPDAAEYLERYPEIAPALRRVLDIHGLVGAGTMTAADPTAPAAVAFPDAGETIAGFQLVEELGRGAFARVFLARERQLADRPVALKVARAGSREPQTLARLQHTHIVPVHSYRTDPATGLHLLCMPYFGRVTLARVLDDPRVRVARSGTGLVEAIDRLGSVEPPRAEDARRAGRAALTRRSFAQAIAWWGARMAEALEHAHDRGVLHRDVKPSNVLITADGMPMLLDFNLAREAPAADDETDRSGPGGTLDYMAPEHLEELADGRSDRVDARSDVFGLGVLLYEALAGARPFAAPRGAVSATEMLLRAAEDRRAGPPRLRDARPEVPAALEAVVCRCLEPDPARRYASAAELAADLRAVADDRPLRHAAEPWPDRGLRWVRRRRWILATTLPVLLAMVGMAALLVKQQVTYHANWAKVRRFYDEGFASERAGDFGRAVVLYESAVRLADQPLGAPAGPAPSALWTSLAELRQQARLRYLQARRTEAARARVDALSDAADRLRFRHFGFGADLTSASNDLTAALEPFHVFEPDDWLRRPDLVVLDDDRRATLRRVVDELLFLWAVALERHGRDNPLSRRKAVELCDLALGFAEPATPWRALRSWIAATLDAPPSSPTVAPPTRALDPAPAEEITALACFEWGVLRESQGDRTRAAAWFTEAARRDESNAWFHYCLARLHDHDRPSGHPAVARGHYDAAVALKPRSPWVRFARARHDRLEGGDPALIVADLQRALNDFHALPESDQDPEFESQARRELTLIRSAP